MTGYYNPYETNRRKPKPRRRRVKLSEMQKPSLADRSRLNKRIYYWIWAQKRDGDWGLYGHRNSREEATQLAYEKCDTPNWEIVTSTTKNQALVTQQMKAKRFETNPDVMFSGAFDRVSHQ